MNTATKFAMVQFADLIDRWSNVERVLGAMSPHDRLHHWNMAVWGEQTKCGTVACAAGTCGLDAWFRERGFKLDFDEDGDAEISGVEEFFGLEGSTQIFLNSQPRPVETVLEEVRAHTGELRRLAALATRLNAPAIGEYWPGHGGINAGPILGADGEPDYFLILGPESEAPLNWDDANSWASQLEVDGRRDFTLPDRVELRALYDRVRHLFERDYYWSRTQHASDSGNAYGQDFLYGYQSYWGKNGKLRARAVRRLPIQ